MFRKGEYQSCISKLQEIINDKEESPIQVIMMQTLGESYYMLYTLKSSSDNQGKHSGSNSEYYENAKQAIKHLGIAYDHQIFGNEDINSMHLDLAMMDCICNARDKPSLSRCLLCHRKCGKGEKLIRSHIWPNTLLRHFSGGHCDNSKKFLMHHGKMQAKCTVQVKYTFQCCAKLVRIYLVSMKKL